MARCRYPTANKSMTGNQDYAEKGQRYPKLHRWTPDVAIGDLRQLQPTWDAAMGNTPAENDAGVAFEGEDSEAKNDVAVGNDNKPKSG